MSTGLIIAIVVVVLIVLVLVALMSRRGQQRRHEERRHEAREIRQEADVHGARADRVSAEADERAARARQEEASAREQAAQAETHHREAEARRAEAHDLDPDTKGEYEERPLGQDREGEARRVDPDRGDARGDYTEDEYAERRTVREGDPDDPDVVREEEVRERRPDA